MDPDGYPWYRVVQGEELAQGDLFDRCPVFIPPADIAEPLDDAVFSWEERDVIVMTQTCDLVPGREKVTEVLLCAAWNRSDLKSGHLATAARPRRRTTRKPTWIPSARGNRPARQYARAPHRGLSARLLAAVDARPQARGSHWRAAAPAPALSGTPVSSLRSLLHARWASPRHPCLPLTRGIQGILWVGLVSGCLPSSAGRDSFNPQGCYERFPGIPDTHAFLTVPRGFQTPMLFLRSAASVHSRLAPSAQNHGLWSFRTRRRRVPDARQTVGARHPKVSV